MNNKELNNQINQYLSNISRLLSIGSDYLLENLGANTLAVKKGPRDYALTTDVELEKIFKKHLMDLYPDIPIMGEETSPQIFSSDFSGLFWAIDPIDGTVNYSRTLPEYGVSIALIDNLKPIAAGVCFPSLKETYIAGAGIGAFLNGDKIGVSNTDKLSDSILAFGDFSVGHEHKKKNSVRYNYVKSFGDLVLRVRMPGTAALQLAWLASGKIDISLTLSNNAWDVQAGVLLVREAGGSVYDFDGGNHNLSSKYTIASNQKVKESVINLISKIDFPENKSAATEMLC